MRPRPVPPGRYWLKLPGSGRRWGRLLWLGGLAGLLAILFVGQKNVIQLVSLYHSRTQLGLQRESLQAANLRLQHQIEDLHAHPQAVEPIAREELGLAARGELVYRFLPADPGDGNVHAAPASSERGAAR